MVLLPTVARDDCGDGGDELSGEHRFLSVTLFPLLTLLALLLELLGFMILLSATHCGTTSENLIYM